MRELLIKDWGWKVFSLLLATAIWFTVHGVLLESATPAAPSVVSTLTYGELPVTIVSAAADMRNYRLLQAAVSVTVSGPREIIGTLQANQLHATVDLTTITNFNSTKQRVEVSVPAGITVVSIKPEMIGVIPPPR
jgi:YbbR domain-containing protein